MNNSKTLTPKGYLFKLSIIHAGSSFAILLFTIVIFLMNKEVVLGFTENKGLLIYIVPIVCMIAYFGTNYFFNQELKNMVQHKSLKKKLLQYQKGCIIRFAILEGAVFLSSTSFMITNNIFYLVISILLILYLIKLKPTKKTLVRDLNFSMVEKQKFQEGNNPLEDD